MDFKPGDIVEIVTEDEKIIGILLPRPEILDQDILVVKLENGYNIGIERSKIKNIKLKEEYSIKPKEARKLRHNSSLPNVTILSTGGTISSKIDYRTGGVYADYTAEDFVEMLPELENIANIKAKKIMGVMSEDMAYEHWKIIAEAIAEEINNGADGVVVTQGTDTLHFSVAAASFFLPKLSKPVVFTAAQRSIDRGSSDAFMNLLCAVHAAARCEAAEVMTCMHADMDDDSCFLIRGTKVRKMHTSRRDAFRPINDSPIARVHKNGNIEYFSRNFVPKTNGETEADTAFEEKVALITVYPTIDPEIINFYLDKGYKGIVLAATALGHVPTAGKHSLLPQLEMAKKMGVPIVIATQTIYGSVNPYVYSNLRKLSMGQDCIYVADMLPDTAYIKLGFVLAHEKDKEKISKMMQQSLHGEINTRDEANYFLY